MNAGMSVVVQPSQAILPAVWKLMRLRWRITLNNFQRSKLISKIFTILVLGLLTVVGLVFCSAALVRLYVRRSLLN
jgi:hypothetical protein